MKGQPQHLTVDRPSSPGVRQLSVGEVRVRVKGDRGVFGVRGEGSVSQALYPLGGGVGIATPERWQQPSASNIQASRSFSLSQSNERDTVLETCYSLVQQLLQGHEFQILRPGIHPPCARSNASAVNRGACSMSAVSTISMSFSLRRS